VGLKPEELARYSRQLCLRDWGTERQERLKNARILVVGAGGLGAPALYYLAAAGVGHLGIAEPDRVELSNLQRQILFTSSEIGEPKASAARRRLTALNPEIEVAIHPVRAGEDNIDELISHYDLVIDATDGFDARYAIHDACYRARKPYVYGAVDRFEGRVGVFFHGEGPCCRCLFPSSSSIAQSCAEAGVIGVLPGVIGTLQATEALKIAAGIGEPLNGKVLVFDALSSSFVKYAVQKNPRCPLCGTNPAVAPKRVGLSARELRQRLASAGAVRLIDVREKEELESGSIPGSLNLPLGELESHFPKLDKNEEILVYCERGVRSARAAEAFKSAGFNRVRHLEGGYRAYQEQQP
jgi:adenylyltransferase/sulfurtransferase